MALLTVEGVVKQYGSFTAVNHVSFEAQPGRILGLLGPNGAGKTSTIRMITYITTPDEGQVRYEGKPVGSWSQERIGYLPEERGLYKKLKVGEQLMYLAQLRGLSLHTAKEKVRYWLNRLGAEDWILKKTEELSKGMQQKIQFIAAIMHDPSLLILDEPFGGLDPINSELLKDIIIEMKDLGRAILFASHRMEQVEKLCDDICLMSKGKIILKGSLRDIKKSFGRNTVVIEYSGDDAFLDRLINEEAVDISTRSQNRVEMKLINGTSARDVMEMAIPYLSEIYRFELIEPPLTEIFVSSVTAQDATDVR